MSKANLLRQENVDTGQKSNFWKNSAGQAATICAENGQVMFRVGTLLQAAATINSNRFIALGNCLASVFTM